MLKPQLMMFCLKGEGEACKGCAQRLGEPRQSVRAKEARIQGMMVEPRGVEPLTSAVRLLRSPN
jgi:hypothetical protein